MPPCFPVPVFSKICILCISDEWKISTKNEINNRVKWRWNTWQHCASLISKICQFKWGKGPSIWEDGICFKCWMKNDWKMVTSRFAHERCSSLSFVLYHGPFVLLLRKKAETRTGSTRISTATSPYNWNYEHRTFWSVFLLTALNLDNKFKESTNFTDFVLSQKLFTALPT